MYHGKCPKCGKDHFSYNSIFQVCCDCVSTLKFRQSGYITDDGSHVGICTEVSEKTVMQIKLKALRESRDKKLNENEQKQIGLRKEREEIYKEFTEARNKIIMANKEAI